MEAKYTPGPWKVDERFNCFAIEHHAGNEITFISHHYEDENGEPCGSISSQDKTQTEIHANAKLIAAAPCLLELCKTILNWLQTPPTNLPGDLDEYEVMDLLKKAIAAAEGKD